MRLLIIGKEDSQITLAGNIAKNHGAKVVNVPDSKAALSILRSGKGAELLFIDVSFDVESLIVNLEKEHISIPVVGYGLSADTSKAVAAIKAGAKEYIPLPPDEKLIAAVLEAISDEDSSMIYSSDEMKKMVALADRIAQSNANILVTGESGTGKEVISRYIHKKSKRADENFVSVNCAAIPENLLESELFGHEKGAFTGALHRRIGKFEESDNGTLLLDEISEMDLRLQAKLLRAIQEKEIDRVGGTKPIRLNLRVIATSNRDLIDEVRKGNFREDLFFRLNVIQLHMPPLRERKKDIPLFAKHFIKKFSESNGIPVLSITEKAIAKLESGNWRGNVRELENAIHRAVLLCAGEVIDEDDIEISESSEKKQSSKNIDDLIGKTVESVEQELILGTLDHCLGNSTRAASILGISIRTLRNKLKAYDEKVEEYL